MSFYPPFQDQTDLVELLNWANKEASKAIKTNKFMTAVTVLQAVSNIIFWVNVVRGEFLMRSTNYPPPSHCLLSDDEIDEETGVHYRIDSGLFDLLHYIKGIELGENNDIKETILLNLKYFNEFFSLNSLPENYSYCQSINEPINRSFIFPKIDN